MELNWLIYFYALYREILLSVKSTNQKAKNTRKIKELSELCVTLSLFAARPPSQRMGPCTDYVTDLAHFPRLLSPPLCLPLNLEHPLWPRTHDRETRRAKPVEFLVEFLVELVEKLGRLALRTHVTYQNLVVLRRDDAHDV